MKNLIPLGVAAVLLGGAAAHAQETTKVQKPLSIKLGVYLPSSSGVKNAIGSSPFNAGLDYAFQKVNGDSPTLVSAYADFTTGSKNGTNGTIWGVGAALRQYANKATNTTVAPFYGAGLGVYFSHFSGIKTNTQVGGKVNVGLELNSGPFIEAGYTIIPQKVADVNVGGFTIDLGSRF